MGRLFMMILLIFMIIGLILFSFLEKDEDILSNSILIGTDSDGNLVSQIDFIQVNFIDSGKDVELVVNKISIENIISQLMDIDLQVASSDILEYSDNIYTLHLSDTNDLKSNTHPLVTDIVYIIDSNTILFKGPKPIAGVTKEKLYINKNNVEHKIKNIFDIIDNSNKNN
ncbi:MAG: hypothetical protein KGZ96_07260 [Clostridia bacterium]|nr:hypothetical protein [Clostridia bacterium]